MHAMLAQIVSSEVTSTDLEGMHTAALYCALDQSTACIIWFATHELYVSIHRFGCLISASKCPIVHSGQLNSMRCVDTAGTERRDEQMAHIRIHQQPIVHRAARLEFIGFCTQ